MEEKDSISIGMLAEKFKVTQRTLRFYEQKGLLHPQHKVTAQNSVRMFDQLQQNRMTVIKEFTKCGVNLNALREWMDKYPNEACKPEVYLWSEDAKKSAYDLLVKTRKLLRSREEKTKTQLDNCTKFAITID